MRTVLIGSVVTAGLFAGLLTAGLDHPLPRLAAVLVVGVSAFVAGAAAERNLPDPPNRKARP